MLGQIDISLIQTFIYIFLFIQDTETVDVVRGWRMEILTAYPQNSLVLNVPHTMIPHLLTPLQSPQTKCIPGKLPLLMRL